MEVNSEELKWSKSRKKRREDATSKRSTKAENEKTNKKEHVLEDHINTKDWKGLQEDYKEQKAILQPLWDEKNTSLTEVNLQANQYTIHQIISTCRFHCEKLFLCLYLSKKSLRTKQRQAKGKQPSKKTEDKKKMH